jgi:hypothetical protein
VNWRAGMGTGTSAGMMSRIEGAAAGTCSGMGETQAPPNQPTNEPVKLTRVQAGSTHFTLFSGAVLESLPLPAL